MTRKRYLAVAGLLAVLVGTGFGATLMLPHVPCATKSSFNLVEERMTPEQVATVFGRDPNSGEIRTPIGSNIVSQTRLYWESEDGAVAAIKFQHNMVTDKWWDESTETVFQKLRRWLRL